MASGLQEHAEARRREMGYLRKAYVEKHNPKAQQAALEQKVGQNQAEIAEQQARITGFRSKQSSYDDEVQERMGWRVMGSPPGHDAESVDRQRRLQHFRDMSQGYSAKIPHRYTSTDYSSQW